MEDFLARLPDPERDGEVRPTHRTKPSSPRDWRTRKDPFESVWPEILLWLQADLEATAKSLLDRLHQQFPGEFPDGQLRTLQRRIQDWRKVMARTLVNACVDGTDGSSKPVVVGAKELA